MKQTIPFNDSVYFIRPTDMAWSFFIREQKCFWPTLFTNERVQPHNTIPRTLRPKSIKQGSKQPNIKQTRKTQCSHKASPEPSSQFFSYVSIPSPPKKIEHHDINSSASLLQIHSLFPFRQLRLVSDPTYPYKNDQQETCPSKNDLQERVSLFC